MDSVFDLSYFDDLRNICSSETFQEKLRLFLFHNSYKEQEGLVELFIEYVINQIFQAQLSSDHLSTFDHMMNHNIGVKEPQFYHFFFCKLKDLYPRKALQCIQTAKQYCYSNFDQIDVMSKELENLLLRRLEQEYLERNYTKKQIQDKFASFEQRVYQSKNKKIKITIDEQFRTLDLREMINELEDMQKHKQQEIYNPEEQDYNYELKIIKPKFQQSRPNLQLVSQSPNFSNDIAVSEELNKLTPISTSSASSKYMFKLNMNAKSTQQQKLIIPIPTINQQNSPLKSLNRMKYKNIQKLRQLIFTERIESEVKEPLKLDSPNNQ